MDPVGTSDLFAAVMKNDVGLTKNILSTSIGRDNINTPNDQGVTPLWFAVSEGMLDMVKLLLSFGKANPNIPNLSTGMTPLIINNFKVNRNSKRIEIARFLLNYGADPYLFDNSGKTALDYAYEAKNQEMITFLIFYVPSLSILSKRSMWNNRVKGVF